MTRAPLSLKARAIGLLAQREHSRLELRRKLLSIERRLRAATPNDADADGPADPDSDAEAAVDELLDALAADGYLDETRFVESRLHVRAERFGSQRIQQELARHGLKLDAEQQAVLRASELDRARSVWLKRFGDQPPREPAEQARQTRFLLARGFAPDVVRRLLRA
ncbi:MAG: recombination regulator RecX [Burkholderiales bacterium]|nr:MAG: recombination regulator RecX [Burkholderiales bacterium]